MYVYWLVNTDFSGYNSYEETMKINTPSNCDKIIEPKAFPFASNWASKFGGSKIGQSTLEEANYTLHII